MMRRVGCHNVMSYSKEEFQVCSIYYAILKFMYLFINNNKIQYLYFQLKYWSKADDPTVDCENLLNLFQIRVLKSNSLTSPLEKKL